MEFWCHYCGDWWETQYCETHFEYAHDQKGVSFPVLEQRLSTIGGVTTRMAAPTLEEIEKHERAKLDWTF